MSKVQKLSLKLYFTLIIILDISSPNSTKSRVSAGRIVFGFDKSKQSNVSTGIDTDQQQLESESKSGSVSKLVHTGSKFLINRTRNRCKDIADSETAAAIDDSTSAVTVTAYNRLIIDEQATTAGTDLGDSDVEASDEDKDTVSVKLKISDVPQEFIVVTGKREVIQDTLNNPVTTVQYLGIPFALPPVNNFRFQRPSLNVPERDFMATQEPPPCPQLSPRGKLIGEENCLFLNIFAPEDAKGAGESLSKLPVLVWFHGESIEKVNVDQIYEVLSSGSASDLSPEVFLQNKIIVVTPQYRIGSLGFLSTVNEDLNGNMGIFDQLLALEWIHRFIDAFGGDSKQITLMGYGGSAMTLGLLATSELARGLFHRIILMSGSPLSPVAVDTSPKSTFAEIALQNSCPSFPTLRFVRCMQQKSVLSLIDSDLKLTSGKNLGEAKLPIPIVQRNADGRFLPPIVSSNPSAAFQTGNFEQVPLLVGVSAAEMAGFLPSLSGKTAKQIPAAILSSNVALKQFIRSMVSRGSMDPSGVSEIVAFEYFSGLNITQREEQAVDLIEEMLSDYLFNIPALSLAKQWSRFAPVYFYVFEYVRGSNDQARYQIQNDRQIISGPHQAIHGSDINFLMTGYKGSSTDREVARPMVDFWINFIHKGSPLNSGIDWPQFREDTGQYIVFRDQVETAASYRFRQSFLWTSLLQDMLNRGCGSRRKTNTNRNSVITFRDPEDFLKYTSGVSPRHKKFLSEQA